MLKRMVERVRARAPEGSFARGVAVLVGGTGIAKLVVIASAPILTRLYTPEDFGFLAVFAALLGLTTVISCMRYELAVPLPEHDRDAASVFAICLASVASLALLCALVVGVAGDAVAEALGNRELAPLLWLLPPGILFGGFYSAARQWGVRTRDFGLIARSQVAQSVGMITIQLLGSAFGAIALVVGQTVSQGIGSFRLGASALRHHAMRDVTLQSMREQASRYRQYPLYSTWNALLNTSSVQLAPVLLASFFTAGVAGLYALTVRVLALPATVLGNAVGSVFLSHAPEAHRKGELASLVTSIHRKLALVGAFPLAVLLFFGPELFALVFGAEWRTAGEYAQWLAPWLYLAFQWSPLSTIATVLMLQRAALVAQVLTLGLRVTALVGAYQLSESPDATVRAFAVASAVVYQVRMIYFCRAAGVGPGALLVNQARSLLVALLPVGSFYAVSIWVT